WFRQGRDRYFVPVAVKIPGADIELARSGGAESAKLDFLGEIRDARGGLQGSVRDEVTIRLKGERMGQLASRSLQYDTGFTLPPGVYTLKFLARENESGKMGTFETKFSIPDLTAEQRRLPISSVVLSNQRQRLSDSVAVAERNKRLLAVNPLVVGNEKLAPSVTRVFRKDQEMFVFLEAYQPEARSNGYIVALVSFFRGKVKAFETAPLQIAEGPDERTRAVPVSFRVPLKSLAPGRYTLQVNVLNPADKKFAVWRSPMVLLP
ncbi:MAG TPA: VWA domain-containing protein, partial [Solibacterales bacterium]|nr:VWA domain-containing protein [Bryobacterales bacterium]